MTIAAAPPERRLRGILLFSAGFGVLATMSALVKYMAQTYPLTEIIWARYFFHAALMLVVFAPRAMTLLASRRKGVQVVRGLLTLGGTLVGFAAYSYLPLAYVSAVVFTVPLLVTALSVPMLGEQVGIRRWAAVLVGFCGMLIVVRPGAMAFEWILLLPLGVVVINAFYQITTRIVRDAADAVTSLFYTAAVGAVLTLPMLWFGWTWPDWQGWVGLVAIGFMGGAGHYLLISAFRFAPVSVIAPFNYTELFWSVAWGFILFNDLPDLWTWVGVAVIMASGLYVWHRERVRRVEMKLSAPRT
jgi:drug/metabolite transporter (DMT)-like permease